MRTAAIEVDIVKRLKCKHRLVSKQASPIDPFAIVCGLCGLIFDPLVICMRCKAQPASHVVPASLSSSEWESYCAPCVKQRTRRLERRLERLEELNG